MTTITIDPLTRLEGHLSVKIQVDGGQVTGAHSSGTLYRGFENILVGRDPRDTTLITQRVCGVCPVSHAVASALCVEAAWGVTVPDNARLIRNLILGANFLQSHILHFYHLSLLDYITGPAMSPWIPRYDTDSRFTQAQNDALVEHYVQALAARRQAHEMGAVFGGKLPHAAAFEVGGITAGPSSERINAFRGPLTSLTTFVEEVYLPDVELLAETHPDYYGIGRGYGNLLAYGAFDQDATGTSKLFQRGYCLDGSTQILELDISHISEQVAHAWYAAPESTNTATPSGDPTLPHRDSLPLVMEGGEIGLYPGEGFTQPDPDKPDAYSWIKAPRYGDLPCEVGPLARLWINSDYRNGISVIDRHRARAQEAHQLVQAMSDWLDRLQEGGPIYELPSPPTEAEGIGLSEAPRGALGHWMRIEGEQVALYQIVPPTCWNCSPRDGRGMPGPLEQALLGTPVADSEQPIEVLRVVHSFDPCLACAVH